MTRKIAWIAFFACLVGSQPLLADEQRPSCEVAPGCCDCIHRCPPWTTVPAPMPPKVGELERERPEVLFGPEGRISAPPGALAPTAPPLGPSAPDLALAGPGFESRMIGDTSGGGCGGVVLFNEWLIIAAHPTFACSRLNISENNSALLEDRLYFQYRHFHNASRIDVFSLAPYGGRNELELDQYLLGFEKRLGPRLSVEVRFPIVHQMPSTLVGWTDGESDNVGVLLNDRRVEIGNMGLIFKRLLLDRGGRLVVSSGLGVNIPTAPDVKVSVYIEDEGFRLYLPSPDPNNPIRVIRVPLKLDVDGIIENEWVTLNPFLAMYLRPTEATFAHFFVQWDIPVTKSTGHLIVHEYDYDGQNFSPSLSTSVKEEIEIQTVMRASGSIGRWIYENPDAALVNKLGLTIEVHYTTTLNDSKVVNAYTFWDDDEPIGRIAVGNLRNRIDAVNMVVGVPVIIRRTLVQNGFAFPLVGESDRGFDFEYALIVDRRF